MGWNVSSVSSFLLLVLAASSTAELTVSLDSTELDGTWKLRNQNGSITGNGRVPGGIYSDLQDTGILNGSIFYRNNDREFRWVARENWTYSRTFDVPVTLLGKTVVNLVFYGVDTVSEIYLNGQLIGSTDNMFRRYIFPVTRIAQPTNNTLEVRFQSAITYAAARYAENPIPPACVADEYQGECHANMIRKMQASFSWDWGPAFPGVGLWKSVEIEGFDDAVIRDVTVYPQLTLVNDIPTWRLIFTVYADLAQETFGGVSFGILHSDNAVVVPKSKKIKRDLNSNYSYIGTNEFEFDATEIRSWWPNGLGEQFLYQLNVSLVSTLVNEQSERSLNIGFRTIKLIQGEVVEGKPGLSFYFMVNSVPFFAKGSNWIPGHILPELGADPSAIRHLLLSAKEANMNMLRVWGGGVYESDLFYEIADELGILIWQDMMFACAMYPADLASLASAKAEVQQQVRRMQYHPSIAIWAGNNENEAALRSNWYGTNSDFDRFKSDYVKLYVSTIDSAISEIDESRPYVISSPSNGYGTEDEGFVADNPYSPIFGDVHYYNYVSDGWDSYTFPDTRFASEYGFQSMPSFTSLQEVSVPTDWNITSEFAQRRQHHPGGNTEMANLIRQHLPLPANESGTQDYFTTFIYYSQISQAMSTKTESERYRRDRSKLTADGVGNTMGALYWQLNDVWQAPTWASIELSGRWKMLHYYAKKFFSPILVSSEVSAAGDVNLYLVSDLLEDVPDLQLNTFVRSFTSFSPVASNYQNVTLQNATSTLISTTPLRNLLSAPGCSATTCFLHFTLSNGTDVLSDNLYFPASFTDVALPAANITVDVSSASTTSLTLTISSDAVAPFLWLETASSGTFSDNGFTLLEPQKNITFETRGDTLDQNQFLSTLTVESLGTKRQTFNVLSNMISF